MISPWVQEEMASAHFGDQRLDERAAIVLSAMGDRPNLSIPAACRGHAETQAAYRFFDNDKVTFAEVLAPHVEKTLERVAGQKVVLLVQDTTTIDVTRPQQQVKGVGQLEGTRRGVLLHVMEAFTVDGTPLGAIWADVVNRVEGVSHAPLAQRRRRWKRMGIEQKESMRWLEGLRRGLDLAKKVPQVQCICIADSESDIYECFAEPRGGSGSSAQVDWLIRACQNRAVKTEGGGEQGHLHDGVLGTPVLYEVQLQIRAHQARMAVGYHKRDSNRQARLARMEVRAATLTLRPPWRSDRELPPVTVNVVLVLELDAPAGEVPVEWLLLTTLPIDTPEAVRRIVEYYSRRWNIELLFRILKSGCRIEHRRFEDVARLAPCMALCLIAAWRTLFVCRMGRQCPDVDCEAIFEPSEWKALWVAVRRRKPPRKRPTLAEIVHLVASLGGYIERRNSEPGPQTLWIGLQRMYDLAWAWDTFGPEARPASS